MCAAPPRSATIVGRAVPTMVWSRAASNIPSMIVTKTPLRCLPSSTGGAGSAGAGAMSVVVTPQRSHRGPAAACRVTRSGHPGLRADVGFPGVHRLLDGQGDAVVVDTVGQRVRLGPAADPGRGVR